MKLRNMTASFVRNKRVLLRVDYNVPLKKRGNSFVVADDARIKATLSTIEYLRKQGAIVVLMSWLGRPGGKKKRELSLQPVAKRLGVLLKKKVPLVSDCVGPRVTKSIAQASPRDVILLENTRFHQEEEASDPYFAKELVQDIDVIVFDAFAQSHRIHASTTGILKLKPSVAGLLLQKEIKMLSKLEQKIKRPYVVILGGVKVSTRLDLMKHILKKADCVLIGGALANTFLKAQGVAVGRSLVDTEPLRVAEKVLHTDVLVQELLKKNKTVVVTGVGTINRIQLPRDLVSALHETDRRGTVVDLDNNSINEDAQFVDIGPKTIQWYTKIISNAHTVFFNGPIGYFENKTFAKGSKALVRAIGEVKGFTVAGGGDTERFITEAKMQNQFGHISTGGGAALTFLAGKKMPVLEMLSGD